VTPSSAPSPAIVIIGPTASGKSGLALKLAQEFDGVVINADSMQVYGGAPILTAQPSPADQAKAPHRLYGVMAPDETCSAAHWRDLAAQEFAATQKLPIVVGGTGLYIKTLMEGISPIPDIPGAIRAEARALLAEMGNQAFHALLAERDPVMAARLDAGNSQRLARAWEVLAATGRSLADWQADPRQGAVAAQWFSIALMPPRDALYAAIDARFHAMVAQGALEEARALLALDLDPALPVMKAVGLRELGRHLAGEIGLDQAIAQSQQATRNYAKRQMTWLRHQFHASETLTEQLSESLIPTIFLKIRQFLLTTR
jgi:tRNA dimethylallyltransferase